jgi:hypothetical protein
MSLFHVAVSVPSKLGYRVCSPISCALLQPTHQLEQEEPLKAPLKRYPAIQPWSSSTFGFSHLHALAVEPTLSHPFSSLACLPCHCDPSSPATFVATWPTVSRHCCGCMPHCSPVIAAAWPTSRSLVSLFGLPSSCSLHHHVAHVLPPLLLPHVPPALSTVFAA